MTSPEMVERPEYIYPHGEWRMVERRFHESFVPLSETIFSTANGFLGIRGAFEEGSPAYQNGTYVNGQAGRSQNYVTTYGEDMPEIRDWKWPY